MILSMGFLQISTICIIKFFSPFLGILPTQNMGHQGFVKSLVLETLQTTCLSRQTREPDKLIKTI